MRAAPFAANRLAPYNASRRPRPESGGRKLLQENLMLRLRLVCSALVCLGAVGLGLAGDGPSPLATAHGAVEKVEKTYLTILPRGPGGKFQKALKLKLTGTSRVSLVTSQKRAGKMVPVQKDLDVKDLEPKQAIAVIYLPEKTGGVLLSGVAQPGKAP